MSDYKHTLNLPKTSFSMKANLANQEPKRLASWTQNKIYKKLERILQVEINSYYMTVLLTPMATSMLVMQSIKFSKTL